MEPVFAEFKPDLVLVHSDTSTTLCTTLAAYYQRVPVAHIEAGLRTHNLNSPWPEEGNRKMTGTLACMHFAPTDQSRSNLLREGVDDNAIHVTGNTVIDALLSVKARLETDAGMTAEMAKRFPYLSRDARLILIKGHRRENFGDGFERICAAIAELANEFTEDDFLYPVHMNPNVREPVKHARLTCRSARRNCGWRRTREVADLVSLPEQVQPCTALGKFATAIR